MRMRALARRLLVRLWTQRFSQIRLLAIVALLAASTVSTHAQTNWTGAVSNDWFSPANWDAGVPRRATDANINTVTPNRRRSGAPGATALNLTVGSKRDRNAHYPERRHVDRYRRVYWQFAGRAGHGDRIRRRLHVDERRNLVVGGLGTGTLTIQNGGMVNSGGGGSVGLSAGSTGTVTVTGPGSTWNNSPRAAGSISAVLARARLRSRTVGRSSITPPSPPTSAMVQARWAR